jgi:protein TonB
VELGAASGRPEDRLVTAVFVAALLHGLLILGLRFAAPPADERPLPTLEVVLVPDGPAEADNPQASYISSRDQRGSGTTPDREPASLPEATASLLANPGEEHGEELAPSSAAVRAGTEPTITVVSAQGHRADTGEDSEVAESAAVQLASRPLPMVGVNASAADETLRLRGDPSPDDELRANTRDSQIAVYLDGWKRRIERIGTLHFPEEARRPDLSGNPVLEVVIRADGSLQQILVRRTSGHRQLDNAAIRTVRLAAPFDPFPPAMKQRYPVLRFAYEWQFLRGRIGEGALYAPAP